MDDRLRNRQILRRIWVLALPAVTYNFLEMTLGLADLIMVRSFGSDATAAIGLVRQITFLVETAIVGISAGVITMVSQGLGKGERVQVEETIRESLLMVLGLGIATVVAGYFLSRPLFVLLMATPETVSFGASYLRIYFFSVLFLGFNAVSAAIFIGSMDAKTPLKIAVVMTCLNIPLNYLFIHGGGPVPAFEVQGAAIGTAAARGLAFCAFFFLLVRGSEKVRLRFVPFREMAFSTARKVLSIGMPVAVGGILRNTARLAFLSIVGFSAYRLSLHAGVGVGMQVRLVAVLPALAFQVATAALVGEAVGRKDYAEAEAIARTSLGLMMVVMVGVTGAMIVFSSQIASVFIADVEVAALGSTVIRWFAAGQFFSALAISVQGSLSGAGDTRPVMRYMLVTQWGFLVPASYVSIRFLSWDPTGPLVIWAVSSGLAFLLLYFRFKSGRWKSIRL